MGEPRGRWAAGGARRIPEGPISAHRVYGIESTQQD